nr:MAG TPA: preprotein translocase [Caudoviricetes sp.]DAJ83172.1 MAG TPA: hypothetical protein [Caudoviricetes sp.]
MSMRDSICYRRAFYLYFCIHCYRQIQFGVHFNL